VRDRSTVSYERGAPVGFSSPAGSVKDACEGHLDPKP